MKRYIMIISLILSMSFIFVACSNNETEQTSNESDSENETEVDENEAEKNETPAASEAEENEQMINGMVTALEDENTIRIEAETNLQPGTPLEVRVNKAFGEIDASSTTTMGEDISGFESEEVQEDGTFSIDYPMHEDFFDDYLGEYIEVSIQNDPITIDEDIIDAYGEDGEKLSGPFVYQFSSTDDTLQNQIYASIYMIVGDEQKEYPIEEPNRDPLPEDYGETDVWIDAEVVDNDDRFLYIEGKSNLLEGLLLQGRYYPEEETTLYQGFRTETYIEPDGTFLLPVNYDSITSDGYIEIQGAPESTHRTKEYLFEEYGENFNQLSGDVVEEVDDHQEILLTIDREGLDMDTPEDSFVTEEDGEVKVQVPEDVLFDFDKSDLKKEAKSTMEEVIEILEDLDDGTAIEINGHTDNQGEADYNIDLSEDRAKEVESYINENSDTDHLTIDVHGYGESKPIASNESEDERQKNRRVTIVINNKK